ncbi:MAG: hypothetical protein HC904_08795 [Blastochloris sp.]|nr:hypothetical protein [Blastochloris sp.]
MVRTQIQLPEELYRKAKDIARDKEWTLTEVIRRGLEDFIDRYPKGQPRAIQPWSPPKSFDAGWKGLTDAQIKEALLDDMEPILSPVESKHAVD